MIRKKKIRGHKRVQRSIEKWTEQNKIINIQDFLANKYCYAYLGIQPYFSISSDNNNSIPEPASKTRKDIILGLETIYNNWKTELDKLNQPYFLKIYLFEPRVSKSQVICALGNKKIDYYQNFFRHIDDNTSHSEFQKILSSDFKWETHSDDNVCSEEETDSLYYVLKGKVYIGGK